MRFLISHFIISLEGYIVGAKYQLKKIYRFVLNVPAQHSLFAQKISFFLYVARRYSQFLKNQRK